MLFGLMPKGIFLLFIKDTNLVLLQSDKPYERFGFKVEADQ
ncbi:hypothetical protein J2Y67_003507 [Neobacillus niacini]|nr:hypothetical protein [Neobacillus niacini]